MDQAEFDKFADEYRSLHAASIRASGESPEYFAEYKIVDVARDLSEMGIPAKRILDFGAGVGTSVPYVRRYLPGASLTCLDVSAKSLQLAASRFNDAADFRSFDGHTIPFPEGSFDVAFTACVFHHVDASEHLLLLREILRVLRPGGAFFLFEHNPLNPLTVRAVNTCPFDENAVLIRASRMCRQFEAAGFSTIEQRYRIFFPRALKLLRSLEPLLYWCPFGAQYYVSARK